MEGVPSTSTPSLLDPREGNQPGSWGTHSKLLAINISWHLSVGHKEKYDGLVDGRRGLRNYNLTACYPLMD